MRNLIIDRTSMVRVLRVFLFFTCVVFFSHAPLSGQERAWSIVDAKGSYTPRVGNGFMACKGQFYLFGGIGSRSMDVFDPETDTWTRGPDLPVNMHHFQAVRLGDEIFVLGAFTGDPPGENVLEDIFIFSTTTSQWRKGDPFPDNRLRACCGVVAFKDMIYMIGGRRNNGESCNWVDRYDPATGQWKILRAAPSNREYFHAAICNGKIYAAGGQNNLRSDMSITVEPVPEVDVYSIGSNRWNTLPAKLSLPTPRAGCGTVVIFDHLLVMGGETPGDGEVHEIVEAFDVHQEKWGRWDNLNRGRTGTQAFMCVGTVFFAGGNSGPEGGGLHSTLEMLGY